ncbi:phosphotransferase [Arthrobacter livingstonensis]|uniref:Phosphotransferase n=1 Tax=Arthrobacter livingstonensis TaxID=670078 RepID=A0A2V5LD61_9MICC|nr:aminoglycoside phosphotransferase family protein [Arthrobacter livingstonensis]PYI68514.1 phosphotransferase [Arthrobacter livingstonensis]
MLIEKLHVDEVDIDTDRVAAMVADQVPAWAGKTLEPVYPAGTDNVMFVLDRHFAVRLPRTPGAAKSLEKELLHAPRLAPMLPAPIPCPVGWGKPTESYPFRWSILRWIEGSNPVPGQAPGLYSANLALDVARFIRALHSVVPPAPTEELFSYRGERAVQSRELETRTAIGKCGDFFDTGALHRAWDIALEAPEGSGAPTWIHTDLHPGNLMVQHGRLQGVLDWGGLAVGDPAVDLIVAWNLFGPKERQAFRAELKADDGTWARGRAWALSIGLVALPYYLESNRALAAVSWYQIGQVLVEIPETQTAKAQDVSAWRRPPA